MPDVLFGQSYYLRFDPKLWAAMQPYPPLGTLYAASYLRERGYEVALFDAMLAESEEEWDAALARKRPRFAVLYEDNFNYLSKMCLLRMREAAVRDGRHGARARLQVVIAGSDATDHADALPRRGRRLRADRRRRRDAGRAARRPDRAQRSTPLDASWAWPTRDDDGKLRSTRAGPT